MSRIEDLKAVESQLLPLRQELIFLKAQLYFAKESYAKTSSDQDRQQKADLEEKVKELGNIVNPLAIQAQNLRIKYLVEYEGQYQDIAGNLRTQVHSEYFYFVNDCHLDTFINGWYDFPSQCKPLLDEVCDTIYRQRFTQGAIRQIKRM